MFLAHQPANVREEEASRRVMRIGVRVRELVVNAMVASPFDDIIFHRHRLQDHAHDSHR